VTIGADGTVSYTGDSSRQFIVATVWDYSAQGWVGDGFNIVYNNTAPNALASLASIQSLFRKSTAFTAIDFNDHFEDVDSDTFTFTAETAIPAGGALTVGVLSGPFTAYGSDIVTIRCTDQYGAYVDEAIVVSVGDVLPDVVGNAQATAVSTIEGTASWTTAISTAYSATVAVGDVISMYPVATTLVPHDQEVTLTVSLGASGVTRPRAGRSRQGRGLLRPGGR
jgi:hypothetical protein